MAQLLIRQIEDVVMDTLRARAKAKKTSVEALARDAVRQAAELTTDEKISLVQQMQAKFREVAPSSSDNVPGWQVIRESRDTR